RRLPMVTDEKTELKENMGRYNKRREQLLDIATNLFAKYGLDGTTTKDIAEAANVSPGLLYHYYNSKEELLVSVIRRFREEGQGCGKSEELKACCELPLAEGLKRILVGMQNYVSKNRDLIWIVMRAAATFPSVHDLLEEFEKSDRGGMIAFLENKIEAGEIKDIDPFVVAKALRHIIVMSNLSAQVGELDIDDFVDIFLNGIKA
ncbi:MAG: TetR/AcrR family transcriptional regulator, partial [Candidatus Bruticola sp.]